MVDLCVWPFLRDKCYKYSHWHAFSYESKSKFFSYWLELSYRHKCHYIMCGKSLNLLRSLLSTPPSILSYSVYLARSQRFSLVLQSNIGLYCIFMEWLLLLSVLTRKATTNVVEQQFINTRKAFRNSKLNSPCWRQASAWVLTRTNVLTLSEVFFFGIL